MKKTDLTLDDINQLHQAGDLDAALAGYLHLLEKNPLDSSLLHAIAIIYVQKDELELALTYLNQAILQDPHNETFQLHLANILKAKGELKAATAILEKLTKQHPSFAAAFNNLGAIYYAQEAWQEAAAAYNVAINLRPNYLDAYYNYGLALNKAGRKREAMNTYHALLELSPMHPGARFQLGCMLMEQDRFEEAKGYFQSLAEHYPFHEETLTNLAATYLRLGNLNEANQYYLKALAVHPDAQILFNLGVIHLHQGRIKESIDFYLQALKLNPASYETHNNLGVAYLTIKNHEMALLHFKEALHLQPSNAAIRHTVNILLRDKKLTMSPPDYVRSLFDAYAAHYDVHLTRTLHYQVPLRMYQLFQATLKAQHRNQPQWDIADLGCGTGLCGELFKPVAKTLIGVDLSEKMLAMAAQKHVYDELVESDILAFLKNKPSRFDLVLAGDVFVYFGELTDVFVLISQALPKNGYFIFNTEISEAHAFEMTETGRFSHQLTYIKELAKQNGLIILAQEEMTLRTQDDVAVKGYLYLLERV